MKCFTIMSLVLTLSCHVVSPSKNLLAKRLLRTILRAKNIKQTTQGVTSAAEEGITLQSRYLDTSNQEQGHVVFDRNTVPFGSPESLKIKRNEQDIHLKQEGNGAKARSLVKSALNETAVASRSHIHVNINLNKQPSAIVHPVIFVAPQPSPQVITFVPATAPVPQPVVLPSNSKNNALEGLEQLQAALRIAALLRQRGVLGPANAPAIGYPINGEIVGPAYAPAMGYPNNGGMGYPNNGGMGQPDKGRMGYPNNGAMGADPQNPSSAGQGNNGALPAGNQGGGNQCPQCDTENKCQFDQCDCSMFCDDPDDDMMMDCCKNVPCQCITIPVPMPSPVPTPMPAPVPPPVPAPVPPPVPAPVPPPVTSPVPPPVTAPVPPPVTAPVPPPVTSPVPPPVTSPVPPPVPSSTQSYPQG